MNNVLQNEFLSTDTRTQRVNERAHAKSSLLTFLLLACISEISETLVSILRPGWSKGRSQALRPPTKSLSIGLKI